MPRYRFSWTNLPSPMLRDLAKDLGFEGSNPSEELRDYYGARPKDEFIKDAWPSLIDLWLKKDGVSRGLIVDELRESGLGDKSLGVKTAAQQLEYLRSCRNAKSLRDVVLIYFIILGEENPAVAAVQRPREPETPPEPTPEIGVSTSSPLEAPSLGEWIEGVLRGVSGNREPVPRDDDGDFAIRHGSALVFVRPVDESPVGPVVHFFSPIVGELEPSPELFLTLNELNLHLAVARVALNPSGSVFLMCDIPAMTLSDDEFLATCALMCDMADGLDTRISDSFGGKTIFEDTQDAVEV